MLAHEKAIKDLYQRPLHHSVTELNKDFVMLKQIVILIAGSVGIIFSMSYAQQAVQLLLSAHDWISQILANVFSVRQAGNLLRGLIALLSIPVFVALIPTVLYWIIRRHRFPYFMEVVWIIWLIQAGALIMMYKAVVAS